MLARIKVDNAFKVYADSLAAFDYIAARPGIDHNKLLVLGQSLDGANAIAEKSIELNTGTGSH
jgi:hypothetical protein